MPQCAVEVGPGVLRIERDGQAIGAEKSVHVLCFMPVCLFAQPPGSMSKRVGEAG